MSEDDRQHFDVQPESSWLVDRIVSRATGTESAFLVTGLAFASTEKTLISACISSAST